MDPVLINSARGLLNFQRNTSHTLKVQGTTHTRASLITLIHKFSAQGKTLKFNYSPPTHEKSFTETHLAPEILLHRIASCAPTIYIYIRIQCQVQAVNRQERAFIGRSLSLSLEP